MRRGTGDGLGVVVVFGVVGGVVFVSFLGLAFFLRFGLLDWSGPTAGAGGVLKVSFFFVASCMGLCFFLAFFLVGL